MTKEFNPLRQPLRRPVQQLVRRTVQTVRRTVQQLVRRTVQTLRRPVQQLVRRTVKTMRQTLRQLLRRLAVPTAALLAAVVLAGCAGPQLDDYAAQQPVFDFRQYFNGTLLAHGLVSDRGGKALRRFVVTMRCDWVGDVGTLDEQFVYSDGERQHRVWRVRKRSDGRFVGTADDVVGEAVGASSGSAFNWRYTLKLPLRGQVYEVQFDDWMHLIDERTVINKAVISKFGVRIGELTLSFSRP